ncbi:unnamed protein product, partial [Arctogadus glacialis]
GGIGASLGTGAEEDLNKGRVCGDADLFFKTLEAINSGEDCLENDLVYCGPAPKGHVCWAQQGMDLKKKGSHCIAMGTSYDGCSDACSSRCAGARRLGPQLLYLLFL